MKKLLLGSLLCTLSCIVYSQPITWQNVGGSYYGSNGTIYSQVGNSWVGNNRQIYSQVGDSWVGNNGVTATQLGDYTVIKYPNGSTKTCTQIYDQITCNK
ncbi:hypothetical protein ACOR62_00065 [Neisseria lisongii]|uniref:Uncharacterized protein n=1 Tax=Neisseria lisongii TaxID=2912188 RepID=A0AAW5AMV9_9NEIS|nr:hypothetical protein [Neisseria lisongii]MCF7530584.1 hypothetical protein [Neisseria lisongii]